MAKMNCSFPWINSYDGPLKQSCGSKDFVRNLVNVVKMVHSNGTYCNIPNCVNTKWTKATERKLLLYKGTSNFTELFLNFPSSTKVFKLVNFVFDKIFKIQTFRLWS